MKFLLILGVLMVASASNYEDLILQEWKTYKVSAAKFWNLENLKPKYLLNGLRYRFLTHHLDFNNGPEESFRLDTYVSNRLKISEHNEKFARGEVGYLLGVNHLTHMLEKEVTDTMNGYNRSARKGLPNPPEPLPKFSFSPPEVEVPDEVDWRQKGAVTPIKNQGKCGSCYAFSATGALEGQHILKKGNLVSLSEQNIMDCSWKEGNHGCEGGIMSICYQYVKDNKGIDTEEGYPYTAHEHFVCKYSNESVGATDSGFVRIPRGDEEALKKAVATIGPISVGIDASHHTFVHYNGGVYDDPECSSVMLDHGVLVIGYGTTSNGTDYWLIKNSWGTNWGEKGYMKMVRNKSNRCGIATDASYPVVD